MAGEGGAQAPWDPLFREHQPRFVLSRWQSAGLSAQPGSMQPVAAREMLPQIPGQIAFRSQSHFLFLILCIQSPGLCGHHTYSLSRTLGASPPLPQAAPGRMAPRTRTTSFLQVSVSAPHEALSPNQSPGAKRVMITLLLQTRLINHTVLD